MVKSKILIKNVWVQVPLQANQSNLNEYNKKKTSIAEMSPYVLFLQVNRCCNAFKLAYDSFTSQLSETSFALFA